MTSEVPANEAALELLRDRDSWTGGFYELSIQLGPPDDARLGLAVRASRNRPQGWGAAGFRLAVIGFEVSGSPQTVENWVVMFGEWAHNQSAARGLGLLCWPAAAGYARVGPFGSGD